MSVHNLTVERGHVRALDDVTVATPPGRITAIVGGDGAGKTTLLEAMVGLVLPQSGSVDPFDPHEIGYMPSGAGSWTDLTVEENVRFVGGSYGLSGDALKQRAEEVLNRAGLDGARDRLAGQLSGGMRRKLAFCLAILHSPHLLVLDEPSTGVDPVSRVELWRLISEAAAGGTAVVMATTYLDEAERAGWVVLLERGRQLLAGTADDLLAACPGEVTVTDHPDNPALAWRSGELFRQWWPHGAPAGSTLADLTLEDVSIVAALQVTS